MMTLECGMIVSSHAHNNIIEIKMFRHKEFNHTRLSPEPAIKKMK